MRQSGSPVVVGALLSISKVRHRIFAGIMNYLWDDQLHLYKSDRAAGFNYSDGVGVEQRLQDIVSQAADRSTFSAELAAKIDDWPSEYHLSRLRHCLLRPLKIPAGAKVLELGCGCGAITRYLGEIGADVVAVEGSLARASVAAERCRELPNVRVVADDLLHFESDEQFDYVLLIGVLEYAALFASGDNPFQSYLHAVTRRLAPRGKVVVAIENKFGLKYFNGCAEDHVGVPFFGVQGLYSEKTARTFGRKELIDLLASAGLDHSYFYYPFPDYKLPSVVLSEAALHVPDFDPVDLIVRSQARDYDGSPYRGFDEALAFAGLSDNGLLADLSNSFLVLAAASPAGDNSTELASAFSTYRAPQFCVQTRFLGDDKLVRVVKEPLTSAVSSPIDIRGELRVDHVLGESAYFRGRQLTWKLLKGRARSSSVDSFVRALRPWMAFLLDQARIPANGTEAPVDIARLSSYVVPGRLLDCTPFNLMEADGMLSPIDLEWQSDKEINLGWVLTRGVLWSLSAGMSVTDTPPSLEELVQSLAADFDLAVSRKEMAAWLRDEADLQTAILGWPCEMLSLHRTANGLRPIDGEFAKARETLSRLEMELRERGQRVAQLEGHVVQLKREVNELRTGLVRGKEQLDRASQTIAQQEERIATQDLAAQERSLRIQALETKLAAANDKLSSLSWKLAAPLHRLGRAFPSATRVVRKAIEGTYLLVTFQLPDRLRQRKVAHTLLEGGLFDASYYLSHNKDVADGGINPLTHYLTMGFREGRQPNPYFDTAYYAQHNPDVMASGINPLLHYQVDGFKEGREPGPAFNGALYLERHPEVRAAGLNPLAHYLRFRSGETYTLAESKDGRRLAAGDVFAYRNVAIEHAALPQRVAIGVSSLGNFFMTEICRMLDCAFRELGVQSRTFSEQEYQQIGSDETVVIVAPHEFFFLGSGPACYDHFQRRPNLIFVNTEQVQTQWFERGKSYFAAATAVLDINYQSAQHVAHLGYDAYFLPLGYSDYIRSSFDGTFVGSHDLLAHMDPSVRSTLPSAYSERPIDVLFIGTSSPRRHRFFARYASFFADKRSFIYMPDGHTPFRYDDATTVDFRMFVALARRSKILLNIHRDDEPYLEWQRIATLGIMQNTVVVTERCPPNPCIDANLNYLEAPLDGLTSICEFVLNDPGTAASIAELAYSKLKTECSLTAMLGQCWTAMASQLPGRKVC